MKYERIDIIEKDEDEGDIALGTVRLLKGRPEQAEPIILKLWDEFTGGTEYDADSEFIDFLEVKRPDLFKSCEGNYKVRVYN